jgi:hypothetical protein
MFFHIMKDSTTSTLGLDVPVSGVSTTVAELVEAAGGEQALVDKVVGWAMAHNVNTTARSLITEALEKVTGESRKTKQKASPTKSDPNNTIEVYDESEQTYTDRVCALKGWSREQLGEAVLPDVGTVPFKLVGEPRTGGPGRVGKEDAKKAETLLNGGDAMWTQAVQLLLQKNPGLEIPFAEDGKPTVETLANAIKVNRIRQQKEADAELGLAA